jgi:adenosine deaminase
MRDLRALPKAELHVHLEGSMRPATARELAEREGAAPPRGLGPDGWRFDGPLDFIEQYVAACGLLTGLEDFRRLALEFCQDLAREGVRYAEAVFSPSNHASRLGDDWFGPIEAVLDGLAAGERRHGVAVRLAPDIVRDLGVEEGEHVLEAATKFAGAGVVALGCAGSERTDIAPFGPLFRRAKQAGLRSVPHAGEWAGPDSVWQTLASFAPDRIGHGVRSIEDPRLVEHLAARRIPLEVCPVSNIATGVYASLEEHPFVRLRDAGVPVTLNSDDPTMFGAWVSDVYERARSAWGLTDDQLADVAHTAVDFSFAPAAIAEEIRTGIDRWLRTP